MEITELGTVVGVWAHPDDESYLSGGLMAALAAAGARVVCVTATRGEAGPAGPWGEPLGSVRARELAAALAELGVSEHRWLGFADGHCAEVDPEVGAKAVAEVLAEVRPDTVVTFGPDGFTGHLDHRAVGGWAALAAHRLGGSRLLNPVATAADLARQGVVSDLLGVFAEGRPRVVDPAGVALRLDLSGDLLARKVAALTAHRTQTRALLEILGRTTFADWLATETFAVSG